MRDQNPVDELASGSYLKQSTPGNLYQSIKLGPSGMASALAPSVKSQEQSWYDVTVGSFTYGAADTGALLTQYVGDKFGSEYFLGISSSLEKYKRDNPNYAPAEVDGALGLLFDSKAIAGRVFSAAPQLLATAGLTVAAPMVGIPFTLGLSYAVESQRMYNMAKADGASETEADQAAVAAGTVNALLEVVKVGKILNVASGARKALTTRVVSEALAKSKALNLGVESVGFLATQGTVAALQGSSQELIPLGLYAKPVEGGLEGFVGRRLEDFVGGAAAGAVFGLGAAGYSKVLGKPNPEAATNGVKKAANNEVPDSVPAGPITVWNKESLGRTLQVARGYSEETANGIAGVLDATSRAWSKTNNLPIEQFWGLESIQKIAGSPEPVEGPVKQSKSKVEAEQKATATADMPEYIKTLLMMDAAENLGDAPGAESLKKLAEKQQQDYEVQTKAAESKKTVASKSTDANPLQAAEVLGGFGKLYTELMSPQQKQQFESYFPPKKTKSGAVISAEEQMGKAVENYLRNGAIPVSDLVPQFEGLKNWIRDVWQTKQAQGLTSRLPTGVQLLLDSVVFKPIPTVEQQGRLVVDTEARLNKFRAEKDKIRRDVKVQVDKINRDIEVLQKNLKTITDQDTRNNLFASLDGLEKQREQVLSNSNYTEVDTNIKATEKEFESQRIKLNELKESMFIPGERTPIDNAELQLRERVMREGPTIGTHRGMLQRGADTFKKFFSMEAPLRRFGAGRVSIELADRQFNEKQSLIGQFANKIDEANVNLSRSDSAWLMQHDGSHRTNLRRLVEQDGPDTIDPKDVPSPAILRYAETLVRTQRGLMNEAQAVGMTFEDATGAIRNSSKVGPNRVPVVLSADAKNAIITKNGPMWDGLVRRVSELNKIELSQAESLLSADYGEASVRRSGSLEYSRKIPVFPLTVEINGKEVAVQHTEPTSLARLNLQHQAERIATVKVFGQATVKEFTSPVLKKMMEIFGIPEQSRLDLLRKAVDESYGTGTSTKLSEKDLMMLANKRQLQYGYTKEMLVNTILAKTPDINRTQYNQLTELLKKLGGFDDKFLSRLERDQFDKPKAIELINEIKKKIARPEFDGLRELKEQYMREGGSKKDIEGFFTVMQGLPHWWLGNSTPAQVLQAASTTMGAMQTSLAAIPNTVQTLTLVPGYAGVLNYLKATGKYLAHPNATISDAVAISGMHRAMLTQMHEPGGVFAHAFQTVREVSGIATLQTKLNDFNRFVATEAFRLKAESIKNNGLWQGDVATLRFLRLSEKEISDVKAGRMTDQIYSKIVQNGVFRTQFTEEAAFRKGYAENIPIVKMLLSYSTYAFGTTRANIELAKDTYGALKSGNPAVILQQMQRTSLVLSGYVGAGFVSELMRATINGRLDKAQEESTEEKFLQALNESAMFGMAHRVTDTFKFEDGGSERYLIGMAPQLSAYLKIFGALIGKGKFGEFGVGTRVKEELIANTPVIRAARQWMEDIAYPDKKEYDIVRQAAQRWKKSVAERKPASVADNPMRADYLEMFEDVKRSNIDGALEKAVRYYESGMDAGKSYKELQSGLKVNLSSRAPLNLSDEKELQFLYAASPEMAQRALIAQAKYVSVARLIAP